MVFNREIVEKLVKIIREDTHERLRFKGMVTLFSHPVEAIFYRYGEFTLYPDPEIPRHYYLLFDSPYFGEKNIGWINFFVRNNEVKYTNRGKIFIPLSMNNKATLEIEDLEECVFSTEPY